MINGTNIAEEALEVTDEMITHALILREFLRWIVLAPEIFFGGFLDE